MEWKKLKVYARIHAGKFLFCLSILLFLFVLLGLTSFNDWKLLGYLFGLGSLFFCFYFARDYYTKRSLYAFLTKQKQEIIPKDSSLESQLIQERMENLLKEQEQMIHSQTKAKEQQITFMNLWVHQMKTPISILELMAQEHQLDGFSVLKQTQRLKNGLTLALNEARLVDGIGNDFVLTQVSLSQVVTTAINVQKNYFIHHQVYPKVTIKDDIRMISDEKWLIFIIEQLLINSVKYSNPNGQVLIEGEVKNGIPVLTITDFGVGISPEDLPRIKQAFFTGENGRQFGEATGMGLYLVEQVAKSLELTITIHSQIKQGTTVTLSFPAVETKSFSSRV